MNKNKSNCKIIKEENSSRPRWQYHPLSHDELQQIHETSMQVLEETGFEVQEPEAFDMFKKAGCMVDPETRVVKINESKVKNLLATVPSQITLCGRDPKHDIVLGAGNVYFGTGGTALNVLDYQTQKKRRANIEDLVEIVRIVDHLKNVHFMLLPTYPNEIPVENVDINRFFAGLQNTSKHIMGGVYTSQGIDHVIEMAEKIAGSAEALRERPFISMITCGISPLRVDSKYGKFMIQCARKGIPTAVPVEPLCGATAPVTLAGTLVIQNCDGLINMMTTQLANPGAPVIYGSVATAVNLHDVRYLGGPVESGMINAATAQLARFYGFPYYSTAGISDSKTLDAQCGYESAINNLLLGLCGGDLVHDAAGLMEFATAVSKEKLILDNEIIGMVLRAARGIQVDKDTLAYDVIKHAGPGGNFIAERHTRRYMNHEHFTPHLSDRQSRDTWESKGSKTTDRKARERVVSILKEKPPIFLEKELEESLLHKYPNIQVKPL
ncbi:MAG: trimethylamine methyltransferase family protein [bacterium]